jgi:hypothetical protein
MPPKGHGLLFALVVRVKAADMDQQRADRATARDGQQGRAAGSDAARCMYILNSAEHGTGAAGASHELGAAPKRRRGFTIAGGGVERRRGCAERRAPRSRSARSAAPAAPAAAAPTVDRLSERPRPLLSSATAISHLILCSALAPAPSNATAHIVCVATVCSLPEILPIVPAPVPSLPASVCCPSPAIAAQRPAP